jgi:hypothetical protein
MKKFLVPFVTLSLLLFMPEAIAADSIVIASSTPFTATIDGVGAVWKGNIPTKISYPAGSYSQKLEFQIQGVLPYSVLADRATGTQVEFELWSEQGKKIAYDTVYESDWNPVGPNTLVSMYLYEADAVGTPTLIVRTIYELSTTGLLTRYLKSEQRFSVSISTVKKPATIDLTGGAYETDGVSINFSGLSDPSITSYELGMRFLRAPGLDFTQTSSYSDFIPVGTAQSPKTYVKYSDIRKYASNYISEFNGSAVGIAVRAKNAGMTGDWGKWYYFETKYLLNYEQTLAAKKETALKDCNDANNFAVNIRYLDDSYRAKYPANNVFGTIKPRVPADLDCTNAGDGSMISAVAERLNILSPLWSELDSAMKLAVTPPPVISQKTTITCVKGKLTKKVTGTSPKCPSGYKKK